MFGLKYSINEIFISRYGYWINGEFVVAYPGTYYIVKKNHNRYQAIINRENLLLPNYEKASDEEKENCCLWDNIESIYQYLTPEELNSGRISIDRLYEIFNIVNGVIPDNRDKQVKNGNVLSFRKKLSI